MKTTEIERPAQPKIVVPSAKKSPEISPDPLKLPIHNTSDSSRPDNEAASHAPGEHGIGERVASCDRTVRSGMEGGVIVPEHGWSKK